MLPDESPCTLCALATNGGRGQETLCRGGMEDTSVQRGTHQQDEKKAGEEKGKKRERGLSKRVC